MDLSLKHLLFGLVCTIFLSGCASGDALYVACAPEEILLLLRNPSAVTLWLSPRLEDVHWDTTSRTLSLTMPLPGRSIPQQFTLRADSSSSSVLWQSGASGAFPMTWQWDVQPEGTGSRVHLTFSYRQESPLLAMPVTRMLRDMQREMLARLKSAAEERCTPR